MNSGQRLVSCLFFVIGLAISSAVFAADWAMWRYDARRSAATDQVLSAELGLAWVRAYPRLKPAFRSSRLQFDGGYEPIVMGKTLFVASSGTDSVTALDTETGAQKWRFYADGPVRFAPVAWKGKVYFGSDDGYLYCLDAGRGTLRWKFRAVPSDRKVLGNGRLISVWPVRGGPVLADGRLYFSAGVWPFEGIFIYALDAETGKVIWLNDRSGSLYGPQPHGAEAFGGLTPHGYLVINGDELVVPCGAANVARFDLRTGDLKSFALPAEGRVPGGWFAAIDTREARDRRRGKIVFDGEVNRERHEDRLYQGPGSPGIRSSISVGGRTFSFHEGFAHEGFERVTGKVHSMLAADGKLFVVTRDGKIYCFGAKPREPRRYGVAASSLDRPADGWAGRVEKILRSSGVKHGYALVWGVGSGRLAEELVLQSDLHVIAVDPDAGKVDVLRRRLDEAGLYGTRIAIHAGVPPRFGFPPYVANLIVSEDLASAGFESKAFFVKRVFHSLRPYGGIAWLAMPAEQQDDFEAWVRGAKPASAEVRRTDGFILLARAGPLPGSTNYTGNWISRDEGVKAPLGLLWYGDSVGLFKRSPQPWFVDGVMIWRSKDWLAKPRLVGPMGGLHVPGSSRFSLKQAAFMDVYTGRVLSDEEMPADVNALAKEYSAGKQPYQYRPGWVFEYAKAGKGRKRDRSGRVVPPFRAPLDKGQGVNPLTGAKEPRSFPKSYGCDSGIDYGFLFAMRSGTAAYYDKRIESGTVSIGGVRSGCTNSVIPANGVLNVPFFFEGCTCSYPLQTGLALVNMPAEYEQWAAWGKGPSEAIQRVGINFGAPGDRVTESGTLWLDYPSVGGPSPEVAVRTEPKTPTFYYRHSLWIEGGRGWPWVAASGAKGISAVTIKGLKSTSYTVRLYFAEPEDIRVGKRVFGVSIQGAEVLQSFDIVAEAGGRMRAVVKEFKNVRIDGALNVSLSAQIGDPLLCGIEAVADGLALGKVPILK